MMMSSSSTGSEPEQAISSSPTSQTPPPILFRTAAMMAKSKQILKMPTITQRQRVILKILPAVQSSAPPAQQLPADAASPPSLPERLNTVPRFIVTPCGPFNPSDDDYLDQSNNTDDSSTFNGYATTGPQSEVGSLPSQEDNNSALSQSMETTNIMDLDFTSLNTMNADELFSPPSLDKRPLALPPKIDMQKATCNKHLTFFLNDDQLRSLITPETEKSCFEFMQSNVPPTASIIHDADLKSLMFEADFVEKIANVLSANVLQNANENPFQFSVEDNELLALEKLENELTADIAREECVALDHGGYSAAPKRKLQLSQEHLDQDESSTMDSEYPSSVASSAAAATKKGEPKKKRQRGIYRLEDVTNEEERRNYIERRMKNNISSKASRAHKKSYFSTLESNAAHVESENARLSGQIATLESHIMEIKSFLITKFNSK